VSDVRFEASLLDRFGSSRVHRQLALGPLTTFKVGGPADWFVELRGSAELRDALRLARDSGVPVFVLGGGSNVLVADDGVRGLVVRLHGGEITRIAPDRIRADAGVTINGLVRWTVSSGLAGLEAWAGTPGTVGGAVHGNAHFQGRLIGDLIVAATLATHTGELTGVIGADLEFGYDYSRLQRTGEILVTADFRVGEGEPAALRATARESLAFRKRTQPLASPSAGCIFQNPAPGRDQVPDGIPWSAGALVDRAGLKGAREGHARVSTTHANFIVNEGGAKAGEIRTLVERCKQGVHDAFGVELREEIVYMGFEAGGQAATTDLGAEKTHGNPQD
jgi:UDP-N-acetylmuramate dehydrogenase